MNRPGTDLLAIACIVGGGVVAGGATLALARGVVQAPSLECAVTAGSDASETVVALDDAGVAIVRPDQRVRAVQACMAAEAVEQADPIRIEVMASARLRDLAREAAELDREEVRQEVERARREAEQARREADEVRQRVDRIRERVRRSRVESLERAHELREERLEHARDRVRRAEIRVRRPHAAEGLELEGLDADRHSFEFRLEGLEALESLEGLEGLEGLGEAIRLELGMLEELPLELEGLDEEELEREIEMRVEERMRALEERLERLANGPGGGR